MISDVDLKNLLAAINKLSAYPPQPYSSQAWSEGPHSVEITRKRADVYIVRVRLFAGHSSMGLPSYDKHNGIVGSWDAARKFACKKLRESELVEAGGAP